LVVHWC